MHCEGAAFAAQASIDIISPVANNRSLLRSRATDRRLVQATCACAVEIDRSVVVSRSYDAHVCVCVRWKLAFTGATSVYIVLVEDRVSGVLSATSSPIEPRLVHVAITIATSSRMDATSGIELRP